MSFLEAINQSLKTLVESLIAIALILLEYFWVFQDYPPNCQGKSFWRDTCPPASLRPPPVFQLLPALTLLTSEISSLTFLIWRGGGPVLWTGLLVGWNSCHWQCCKRNTAAQIENQTVLRVFEPGEIVNGVVKGNPEAPDVIGACKTVVVSICRCHVAELLGDKMPRPGFPYLKWVEFHLRSTSCHGSESLLARLSPSLSPNARRLLLHKHFSSKAACLTCIEVPILIWQREGEWWQRRRGRWGWGWCSRPPPARTPSRPPPRLPSPFWSGWQLSRPKVVALLKVDMNESILEQYKMSNSALKDYWDEGETLWTKKGLLPATLAMELRTQKSELRFEIINTNTKIKHKQ